MKPLKIKMTAFGPYKDTETIDFEKLGDHQLFVISGQTGAGKTTIFDAISFALYGRASGSDRNQQMMLRSDFASDDVHTSVELYFSLKGRTYRVLRQLGHVKKGNKTKTGDKYEFYEVTDQGEIPCVDRQIVSEIDEKIEELIGLTQSQFNQIVMLPQGEFRKLLTSETENKEEILRKLFKTENYQKLNDRLKNKRQEVEEQYRDEKNRQAHYIDSIQTLLPYREDSPLFQTLNEDHYNVYQVMDGLNKEKIFYDQKIKADEKRYEESYRLHEQQHHKLHQAENINDRFKELDEKQHQLTLLKKQLPTLEKKKQILADAERASKLEPLEIQVIEWKNAKRDKHQFFQKCTKETERAEQELRKNQQIYDQELAREKERESVNRQLNRYEELLPVVEKISEQQSALNKDKREFQKMNQAFTEAEKKWQEKQQIVTLLKNDIQKLEAENETLHLLEKDLNEMRHIARLLHKLLKLQTARQKWLQDKKELKQTYEKKRQQLLNMEDAFLSNQASLLANHLHEGEACPVCGSLEHPNKATDQQRDVSKDVLDQMREKVTDVHKQLLNVEAHLEANRKDNDQTIEELKMLHFIVDDVHGQYEEIVYKGKQMKEKVETLKEKRETLRKNKGKLLHEEKLLAKLEEEKHKLEKQQYELNTHVQATEAALNERKKQIPEDLRELSKLKNELEKLTNVKQQLQQSWDRAQHQLNEAKNNVTKAKTALKHGQEQLTETIKKLKNAQETFQQALMDASFSTEDAYHRAKRSENEQVQMRKEIEHFTQQKLTLQTQIKELTVFLEDKERTNVEHLKENLTKLKTAYEKAYDAWQEAKKHRQSITLLFKQLTETEEKVKKYEQQFLMMTDLYDLLRGQNDRKISFERYLQIEYLEQIIDAANERLTKLSNGQFYLMRSDRQESHGKQSGLGLDVYDSYTGMTRDVKTLSGGEKFNASLCLALGMSDVIQSFQGSISMQTMFIDEGFGSLDEESLYKAVDALVDLQKSGRMIGVISHVEALKTMFPARLEVQKTREGHSQTKFFIQSS